MRHTEQLMGLTGLDSGVYHELGPKLSLRLAVAYYRPTKSMVIWEKEVCELRFNFYN